MKERKWIAVIALAAALAVASGVAVGAIRRADRLKTQVQELYQGAVLSALRQMEDVELSFSKAFLSADQQARDRYLNRAGAGAAQVQRSLTMLPLSHPAGKAAVKFANQLADYADHLTGRAHTENDARQVEALLLACRQYTQALSQAQGSLTNVQTSFYAEPEGDNGSYDSGVSYPTLIYDGPFSDARTDQEPRGLGSHFVSQEEAMHLARDFVGQDRVLSASPGADMGGSIPCWGVTLTLSDMTLQAAVTKQGGKILWLTPDRADFSMDKSIEDCRESAQQFLQQNGFPDMESTYFQVYQGVAVISFAAVQGDTLLYPDLVKVQLRMDTAQVVGVEARNYYVNHGPRGLLTPGISLEEAEGGVSGLLNLEQARLCLIPTDGGEKLCYEFRGQYGGSTYLCYVDAFTGKQEQLLRVIESDTGLEAA